MGGRVFRFRRIITSQQCCYCCMPPWRQRPGAEGNVQGKISSHHLISTTGAEDCYQGLVITPQPLSFQLRSSRGRTLHTTDLRTSMWHLQGTNHKSVEVTLTRANHCPCCFTSIFVDRNEIAQRVVSTDHNNTALIINKET